MYSLLIHGFIGLLHLNLQDISLVWHVEEHYDYMYGNLHLSRRQTDENKVVRQNMGANVGRNEEHPYK